MTDEQATAPTTSQVIGPRSTRWTHIALPCTDIDRTIAWYEEFTPLQLLDRRADADGQGAWLGHPDQGDKPFILVLVSFFRDQDGGPQTGDGPVRPHRLRDGDAATRSTTSPAGARPTAAWRGRHGTCPTRSATSVRSPIPTAT